MQEEKNYDMDITCVKKEVRTCDPEVYDGIWRGQKALVAQETSSLFKNTVLKFLIQNRQARKVPKLADILKISIETSKKQAQAKRQQRS